MRRRAIGLVALMIAGLAGGVYAQPPAVNPVEKLIAAPHLTDEERKDLRIRFGQWEESDLDTPVRRAKAALIAGKWDDASLKDAGADALDRAEAAIWRGEAAEAMKDLGGDKKSARKFRLVGEAQLLLGKTQEAAAAWLEASQAGLASKDADEVAEAVQAALLRSRLPEAATGGAAKAGDYKAMMSTLSRARTELDALSWRARLVEAMVLNDKDNEAQGEEAGREALRLCPRSAEVLLTLGALAVDSFSFDGAEEIAGKLRKSDETSAAAAVVAARARVRQSDPAGAMVVLTPALAKLPRSPLLLSTKAAATAVTFDFAAVDRELAEFEKLFPGSPEAMFWVGKTLSDARQYEESSRYLNKAKDMAPGWAAPVIELGLLELQAGRDLKALDALTKANRLDPFNSRAENSLTLIKELLTYARVESDHFAVRYKPGVDETLAKEMLEPLEMNFKRVTGSGSGGIDCKPEGKTLIELMPDHRWFAVRIAGLPRIHTIAAATGPVVAMEAPRSGPNHLVGPYDWVRVVRHEYTHTVTLARTKNRLPHWFTEAAAVYLEDAPWDFNAVQIVSKAFDEASLFDLDKINLMFVRPEKPTDRSQAYAQGHWMYEFIIEKWGERAPLTLMDEYAKGVKEGEAFKKVLGVGRDEFVESFTEWAGKRLVVWGMMPKEGEPRARDLVKPDEQGVPTLESVMAALEKRPEHPELLELAVRLSLRASKNEPTAEMVPLFERYAKARPVDPLPHKMLVAWYMGAAGKAAPGAGDKIIEHLEYLDIREQYSAAYATELANRYGVRGEWDKAWTKALRAVRIAPYDPRTRELAATVAIKRKDYAAAEWQLKALKLLEPDRTIHDQRLEALRKMRDN